MKKWFLAVIAALCLLASGCTDNDNNGNNGNNGNNQVQQQARQGHPMRQMTNQANPGTNADNRVEIAQAAAERIDRLPGVRQANVLVTRRNAYVAAVLDGNGRQLNRQTEDRIAREVRAVTPDVRNVYVSTNPDFVDRINTYIDDVQQGRPVAGFVEQFNEMVRRIFPDAR